MGAIDRSPVLIPVGLRDGMRRACPTCFAASFMFECGFDVFCVNILLQLNFVCSRLRTYWESTSMSHPTSEGSYLGWEASDCESVDECDHPFPWEAFDVAYDRYLEQLTFLHMDHILHLGCSHCEYFPDDSVDDLYSNNLYAISWFYHGCYDFDTWEADYDTWLYEEAFRGQITDDEGLGVDPHTKFIGVAPFMAIITDILYRQQKDVFTIGNDCLFHEPSRLQGAFHCTIVALVNTRQRCSRFDIIVICLLSMGQEDEHGNTQQ